MNTFQNEINVRVASIALVAVDICMFELVAEDGASLPPFSAGSHVDVTVDGTTRQYSLCNDPSENHRYQIAVLKDSAGRGGSVKMHERVKAGDTIRISAPRNHFHLASGAQQHLLLAGGIGVTPILCMAERLASIDSEFEMHYCARSPERAAFVPRVQQSGFADKVRFHFDNGPEEDKLDIPALLKTPKAGTHVYVCGPKGFMNAVLDTARENGWPEDQLHYEFFASDAAAPREDDGSFQVKLASSGRVIPVRAEQTVTEALAEAGVDVGTSCMQGICGTCITRVLEGTPDHRDMYFSPEEQAANDQFTPCCSRSLTPLLVLDL
ncbi:PDR/VanB family oxidoreductase [Hydrogenophaga sp. BPS33]|uniref:PDR/VanB family oxidoreductase n=1 Tax=Hydrogenophaga sp. BPS33 TaxID=2651974 RepID=UPI00131F71CD|nr:PDR/VanB family oxidoreductase [Hydrogenophaga sp. BPS33]QHE84753.1 oxidoreductase [Hydrogenophaga sp. BPS33]